MISQDSDYKEYVIEKIRRGILRAEVEGTVSQDDIEKKFKKIFC